MSKILFYNNRLQYEFPKVKSLTNASYEELEKIATKYQIGTNIKKTERRKIRVGDEEKTRLVPVFVKKPKEQLEDEIRDVLTITVDVPSDFWNDRQRAIWEESGAILIQEVRDEQAIKDKMGTRYVLKPMEDGLSQLEKIKRMAELEENVFKYFEKIC